MVKFPSSIAPGWSRKSITFTRWFINSLFCRRDSSPAAKISATYNYACINEGNSALTVSRPSPPMFSLVSLCARNFRFCTSFCVVCVTLWHSRRNTCERRNQNLRIYIIIKVRDISLGNNSRFGNNKRRDVLSNNLTRLFNHATRRNARQTIENRSSREAYQRARKRMIRMKGKNG